MTTKETKLREALIDARIEILLLHGSKSLLERLDKVLTDTDSAALSSRDKTPESIPAAKQEPVAWQEALRISELLQVHTALEEFSLDSTEESAVALVQVILEAAAPIPAHTAQGTKERIFTYANQPNNIEAWRFGEACSNTRKKPGGDFIDTGLQLLLELQNKGYGIAALSNKEAAHAAVPSEREEKIDFADARRFLDSWGCMVYPIPQIIDMAERAALASPPVAPLSEERILAAAERFLCDTNLDSHNRRVIAFVESELIKFARSLSAEVKEAPTVPEWWHEMQGTLVAMESWEHNRDVKFGDDWMLKVPESLFKRIRKAMIAAAPAAAAEEKAE